MQILIPIIFGIIQGISEWLPISSSGHLILLNEILDNTLGLNIDVSKEFFEFFLVVIQLASVMAVIIFFFKDLNPIDKRKTQDEKKITFVLWIKVAIACVPITILGLLNDSIVDNSLVIISMLIIFGIVFIVVETINKNRFFTKNNVTDITFKMAFFIGLIQLVAIIPGTSRSGVTILGAMLLGLNRTTSARFSFFLSIPVMLGASLLKGIDFFISNKMTFNEIMYLLVGSITAFAISLLVIKFLLNYIKKHDFKLFGYYRICLGIILFAFLYII